MSGKILDNTRRDILPLDREAIAHYVDKLSNERARFVLAHLLLDLKAETESESVELFDFDRFAFGSHPRY